MKKGDLVVPIGDFKKRLGEGYIFTPFIPNPNTVCTIEWIGPILDGEAHSVITLDVEEVKISHPIYTKCKFLASYWRVIDEINVPINIEELIGEQHELV